MVGAVIGRCASDPLTTEHYPDSLSLSHSEDACDASPNSHATFRQFLAL
jgi:hypothetical protein